MVKLKTEDVIKTTLINSISNYAKKPAKKTAKFQILDLLIPNERKIRSAVGGLETSLGTTLWEPLAKALATNNGFTVHNQKLQKPEHMSGGLSSTLQTIISSRIDNTGTYTAQISHERIKEACFPFIAAPISSFTNPPKGHGVDIWLEKDGINYFFDTKTVQPNLSALRGCLEQVLTWYAYFYSRYPSGTAFARIVFPYNPNPGDDFWKFVTGNGAPLTPTVEALVEDEFWDLISGETNTFSKIKQCLIELAATNQLKQSFDKLFAKQK